MPGKLPFQSLIASGFCLFFAVALQAQITFFQSENYEGLRLNLADLGLPFAGIFILHSLFLKKMRWPEFQKPFSYWWIFALFMLMVFALLSGPVTQWALINKFIGWFVLMAYLGTGAFIGCNHPNYSAGIFLKTFTGFGAFLIVTLLSFKLSEFYIFKTDGPRPFTALMANPNAFGFLFCALIVFSTVFSLKNKGIFRFISMILWGALPFILLISGSRILWLASALLFLFFTVFDWRGFMRLAGPALLLCGAVAIFINHSMPGNLSARPFVSMQELLNYTTDPKSTDDSIMRASGNAERIEILSLSFDLWQQHPVFGAGLGAVQEQQIERHGTLLAVVDNTLLWVLTEMGLVGVGMFLGCYIAILLALRRKATGLKSEESLFAFSALIMMFVFGIFSLFHEVLYTRFMWFILGLALSTRQSGYNA